MLTRVNENTLFIEERAQWNVIWVNSNLYPLRVSIGGEFIFTPLKQGEEYIRKNGELLIVSEHPLVELEYWYKKTEGTLDFRVWFLNDIPYPLYTRGKEYGAALYSLQIAKPWEFAILRDDGKLGLIPPGSQMFIFQLPEETIITLATHFFLLEAHRCYKVGDNDIVCGGKHFSLQDVIQ